MEYKHHLAPEDSRLPAAWSVSSTSEDPTSRLSELVMAWAKDKESGEPVYIFELGADRHGAKSGCVCYSCGLSLTAVNAGKKEWRRRPHFRHPEGAQRDSCLILSARAAAMELLRRDNRLVLPARRLGTKIIGLSGKTYDAWITTPSETVSIRAFEACDRVSAILTLDDGRQLLVRLTGSIYPREDGLIMPVIHLDVDDPRIAGFSPEQLKSKLNLLVEKGVWCGPHWDEATLVGPLHQSVVDQAVNALDWVSEAEILELGPSPTRETLLHWLAKKIIKRERRLRVPDLVLWKHEPLASNPLMAEGVWRPGQLLDLEDICLEKNLGHVRPDVFAKVADSNGVDPVFLGPLAIEITVTNGMSDERLAKIREGGLPTLEINVGLLGGDLDLEQFTQLLITETTAKKWVSHPWLDAQRRSHEDELGFLKLQSQLPVEQLGRIFLEAVEAHSTLRAKDDFGHESSERRAKALMKVRFFADALVAQGYPEAADDKLYRLQGCLLDRLISIRDDRVVGYKVESLWQIINSILCEGSSNAKWQTLYLSAIKVYNPPLSDKHLERVGEWRTSVLESLKAGESKYRRSTRFDRLLSMLFPAMADVLSKPLPGPKKSANLQEQVGDFVPKYSAKGPMWLTGEDLEIWRRRYPEAAKVWNQILKNS